MDGSEDLYFEIKDLGSYIRLQPLYVTHPGADDKWDKSWLTINFKVLAGSFIGEFNAQFMPSDFKYLHDNISKLYYNLSGEVTFSDLEGHIDIEIKGDGIGHFHAHLTVNDRSQVDGSLAFNLSFDQTHIESMTKQLYMIIKSYNIR